MKKKLGYVLLILIGVIGSRLIFGKDYHLNSDNLFENNLYLYDIFNKKDVSLLMIDDEELYYILQSGNDKKMQYSIVKYNLINNKVINQYDFATNYKLENIKMFDNAGYFYFTATNSNTFYKFNKQLELVNQVLGSKEYDSYGVLNDDILLVKGNEVYYQDKLYKTLPSSCGKSTEIIYNNSTYLHFHNDNTGFGCLLNVDNKNIEYLDYSKLSIIKDRLLEYQDNRQSFKYNDNIYYFNDITESNNFMMHDNGDYLFTADITNNTLRIYNLDTRKIIKEKNLILNKSTIKDILIGDYAYFTVIDNKVTKLYIWDYLKDTRKNKDMISYNEKEYKFKNNELKEEIKSKYNIDINIYDQAVAYFEDVYVIPSYDDILINSRLKILKEIFEKIDSNDLLKIANTKICLEKSIISNKAKDNPNSIVTIKNDNYVIAVNITNDNFKNNILKELTMICPSISNTFKVN